MSVQKALAAAESQSREALALSEETEELEAAVCRASQRVAALHEALSGDEAALSARLAAQASRLRVSACSTHVAPLSKQQHTTEHVVRARALASIVLHDIVLSSGVFAAHRPCNWMLRRAKQLCMQQS